MPCIFPFSFRGKIFDECTTFSDPDEKLWCSTKVDENGLHVSAGKYWGHCDDCRGAAVATTISTTTTTTTTVTENSRLVEEKKKLLSEITGGNKR